MNRLIILTLLLLPTALLAEPAAVHKDADNAVERKTELTPATEPVVYSEFSPITPDRVDADIQYYEQYGLQPLIEARDQMALKFPEALAHYGINHPVVKNQRAVIEAMDKRVIALGGPALPAYALPPTTEPATSTSAQDVSSLLRERDRLALLLPTMRATISNGAMIHLEEQQLKRVNDQLIAAGGPGLSGKWLNVTQITQPPVREMCDPPGAEMPLRDLSPEAFKEVSGSLQQKQADAIVEANRAAADAEKATMKVGDHSVVVTDKLRLLEAAQQRVNLYTDMLAVANAESRPRAVAPMRRLLAWLDGHFVLIFLSLIGGSLLIAFVLQRVATSGRARWLINGFYALIALGGVAQLFAAGVAVGLGKPADAWATLLGCAAIMIVIPLLGLRQVEMRYAGIELRKMRALDLA